MWTRWGGSVVLVVCVAAATPTTVDQYWTSAVVTRVALTRELTCIICSARLSCWRLSCWWRKWLSITLTDKHTRAYEISLQWWKGNSQELCLRVKNIAESLKRTMRMLRTIDVDVQSTVTESTQRGGMPMIVCFGQQRSVVRHWHATLWSKTYHVLITTSQAAEHYTRLMLTTSVLSSDLWISHMWL